MSAQQTSRFGECASCPGTVALYQETQPTMMCIRCGKTLLLPLALPSPNLLSKVSVSKSKQSKASVHKAKQGRPALRVVK